jgi:two-component system cell cycle sensor histidine kinase/response regulator CckA
VAGNSVTRSACTILVVDDEPALRGLVARMLRLEGHRVLEAGGGPDAIALYTQHIRDIAVVVTDVVMPDMDGRALANRLLELNPSLGVVLMSGYIPQSAFDTHESPRMRFVSKPFRSDDICRAVRGIMKAPSSVVASGDG